MAFENS